jgi:DNA-binding transcriptional LysR family regulator
VASVPGWTGIELRHFLALEAVASERSFHRAARKLGYTQSAISQQIAALERVVGHKLIERPGGSQPVLRLTRAGEIVMEHAHAIGARLATAQADLQAFATGDLDPLRLGFFGRGLGALMPGICRRLQEARPDVEIKISEAREDADLLGMLRRGEIDLSFVHLPVHGDDYEEVTLLEDDHLLVVGADSGAATRAASLSLEELAAQPLIGFRNCGQLTDYFRSHSLEPAWYVCSDDLESIYAFLATGSGPALLPRLATLSLGDEVQTVQPGCTLPPRRIGLAWSAVRGESGSARSFVEAALAEAARFSRGRLTLAS